MSNSKKKRAKNPVPSTQPKKKPQKTVTAIKSQLLKQNFQGPIPPPELLAGYDQIVPGAAERIISLAENETSHRHMMEQKALDAEIAGLKSEAGDTRIGQVFGLIIGLTTVIAGTYAATNGAPITGGVIGTSGVAGLVSAFIVGRKGRPNDENQPSKEIVPTQEK